MTAMAGTNTRGQAALEVPASVAAGAPIDIGRYERFTVYITGAFVATIDIQVSADDTNWITAATVTAASATAIALDANYVRTKTTVYTSGAPAGYVIGSRS